MVERHRPAAPASNELAHEIILHELTLRVDQLSKDHEYLRRRVYLSDGTPTMEMQLQQFEHRLQALERTTASTKDRVWAIVLDVGKLVLVALGVWLLTQMFTPPPAPPPPQQLYERRGP